MSHEQSYYWEEILKNLQDFRQALSQDNSLSLSPLDEVYALLQKVDKGLSSNQIYLKDIQEELEAITDLIQQNRDLLSRHIKEHQQKRSGIKAYHLLSGNS